MSHGANNMNKKTDIKDTGLRGIVVASSKICSVNGEEGKLIYRGFRVTDLAENTTFEEVIYLLLFERLPSAKELSSFRNQLADLRTLPDELIKAMETRPKKALPMDILQASISMIANHDSDTMLFSQDSNIRMAINLIAKIPTIVAAWERIRNGKKIIEPLPDLSHAANFLYMINEEKPDDELTGFFNTCLVLHAEHSFNASTFTARQIASTKAHMYAAVAGAVGSLSGELHGGANSRVMRMLKEINSVEAVESYINKELDKGRKVMGLGHAVYKVDDPRALILAPMSKKMGERIGDTRWYDISKSLEEKAKTLFKAKKNMDIFVNVDFYSASLYYYMGIPIDLFTPVFAMSRIAGWAAHVLEEQFAEAAPKAVLYRPKAEYTGNYCGPDECVYVPAAER